MPHASATEVSRLEKKLHLNESIRHTTWKIPREDHVSLNFREVHSGQKQSSYLCSWLVNGWEFATRTIKLNAECAKSKKSNQCHMSVYRKSPKPNAKMRLNAELQITSSLTSRTVTKGLKDFTNFTQLRFRTNRKVLQRAELNNRFLIKHKHVFYIRLSELGTPPRPFDAAADFPLVVFGSDSQLWKLFP